MFLLDSLMIDGVSWVLRTVTTAAEAEMNDDTVLREQLLAAEMQRELGEITDEEFADIERDLLTRMSGVIPIRCAASTASNCSARMSGPRVRSTGLHSRSQPRVSSATGTLNATASYSGVPMTMRMSECGRRHRAPWG